MYGTLREVILGYADNIYMPGLTPELLETYGSVLQPEMRQILKQSDGRPFIEVTPMIRRLKQETEILKSVLESYNVTVHMAGPATPAEIERVGRNSGGFTQLFAAEPIWVVGRNVLENVWVSDFSWASLFPVRDLHMKYIDNDPNILHYTAPQPGIDRDYVYEGGDVLNLGDGRVLVGVMKSSTNKRGAEWVKRMLEHDGYKVEIIELPSDCPVHHLTAVMGIAGPKLLIAFDKPFIKDGETKPKLPKFIEDFDVIWVNEEEAKTSVATTVMLNRDTVMVPEEAQSVIKRIEEKGIKTVAVPWKYHAWNMGGLRCKVSVLRRDIY